MRRSPLGLARGSVDDARMTSSPPTPKANRISFARFSAATWLLILLISFCTLIEMVLTLGDQGVFQIPRLRQAAYEYAGFWPGLLANWQPNYTAQPYTMFVSYAFLHGGLVHMAVNMFTLYSLGLAVTDRVGARGFVLVYLAAILGGALCFGLLADTLQPMVGASGGLFGLVGGILAWNYIDRFNAARRLWPVLRAIAILCIINLVLWWAMDGLLAWETHLGGFIAGWIAALLVDPRAKDEDDAEPPAP